MRAQGAGVTFYEMPSFYPAGDEQVMVQLVTGRSIPERGLVKDMEWEKERVKK